MRLQKYISECGYCSRRKAEMLISEGRVQVNGITVNVLGSKVTLNDEVKIDGMVINIQKKIYVMLNKPKGFITAVSDDRGRKTVTECVSDIPVRLFPVGRLDYNTEGLLILTSDGDFANKLIHPSRNIYKTYLAKLDKLPGADGLQKLKDGVVIEDYTAIADDIYVYDKRERICLITISTGKNRQVRKMFDAVGSTVEELKRISIGELKLGNLNTGEYRYLTEDEIKYVTKDGY